jgi:transcription initiation factor IIE alpha subunit
MPKLRVEFKCEACGEDVHLWTQQDADSIPHNAQELVEDCERHPERLPGYLTCRQCASNG